MRGPTLPISKELHEMKYREQGETFLDFTTRLSEALKDDDLHGEILKDIFSDMRFLPAGRVQASMGAARQTTPYNCFVSQRIDDSMDGIMEAARKAAETMRLGGGIGYDFSTLRPRGDRIKSLDSHSSGPVSFMEIFNAICKTISSAGHRRGAQMGVLRVDHPDIEEFIRAKRDGTSLSAFNISVAMTDEFMEAVELSLPFDLRYGGLTYKTIDARELWDEIMESNWDWAEPGVLFIDTINRDNNLWYCEEIAATNPCAEQPLPPNGACLLGSLNMVKYVSNGGGFDWKQFVFDIPHIVRAMDNVIDRALYPLPEQKKEAQDKRRMGLGVTGMANALEILGHRYGSPEYIEAQEAILSTLRDYAYMASVHLASEKGAFPLCHAYEFVQSGFMKRMPVRIREAVLRYGIRNSHLLSIAPTGTISLTADNISSGIEPVFAHSYQRTINKIGGSETETVKDYAFREWGLEGRTANECSVDDHVNVLISASRYVDSAVSKTCNVGADVTREEFSDIYLRAFKGGAKGCTTFRMAGKREGILTTDEEDATACVFDSETGRKTCE